MKNVKLTIHSSKYEDNYIKKSFMISKVHEDFMKYEEMMDSTVDGEHKISVNSISPLPVTLKALTTQEKLHEDEDIGLSWES